MAKYKLPERFSNFIITQMLGAFNDNFFKMLLQLYVLQILAAKHSEAIISNATFLFTIPFVLFGPWSGYLADRYSKSQVMKVVKFAEIGVMLLGALAFYLSDLNLMLAVLFLMATQSSFFSWKPLLKIPLYPSFRCICTIYGEVYLVMKRVRRSLKYPASFSVK